MAATVTTSAMSNSVKRTPASILMESTADAFDNVFDLIINWPWGADSNADGVYYRVSDFTPPKIEGMTYDVVWHGIKVHRIKPGMKIDRKLSFKFRVDANYGLYRKLVAWDKYTKNPNTGAFSNQRGGGQSGLSRGVASIYAFAPGTEFNVANFAENYNASDNMSNGANKEILNEDGFTGDIIFWAFKDVNLVDANGLKYANKEEGNQQEITANFIFGDMYAPYYSDPVSA